jgi:exonuclease SbcD
MRFIHTADWHLGRSFYNTALIEDQGYVLDQLVDLARDTKPNIILIAGDIYDRAVPPTDAVKLLDDVLTRLVLELEIPVILIAGNHDSPQRLQFGARLMRSLKLYVYGTLAEPTTFIQMPDEHGLVCFYPMPYAEPAFVSEHFQDDSINDHESALRVWLETIMQNHPAHARSVVLAHAFVQGGVNSESERRLSLGGAETINSSVFAGFNFVALGHLHEPQSVGSEQIHYAGSLLKYSFSECHHTKSVSLVEIDATGICHIERIPLRAKRDVRVIEGHLNDLLKHPPTGVARDDFVRAQLLDKGALFDPMGQLRQQFPNTLFLNRPEFINPDSKPILPTNPRSDDAKALFSDFFAQVTGEPLSEEQASVFAEIVATMQQREREEGV